MKCPVCGVDVVASSVYCHKCGTRLDVSDQERPPAEQDASVRDKPADASAARPADRLRQTAVEDQKEKDLWQGGYCVKAMAGAWIISIMVSVVLLIIAVWAWNHMVTWSVLAAIALLWLYQGAVLLWRRLGVRYRLTNQRFFHESGILIHTTDLIEVIDMDDITFRQTLIDRLTGVGTIRIVSSDRSHPELVIHGIENVKNVAAKMHDARHAERLRRGLHIESI